MLSRDLKFLLTDPKAHGTFLVFLQIPNTSLWKGFSRALFAAAPVAATQPQQWNVTWGAEAARKVSQHCVVVLQEEAFPFHKSMDRRIVDTWKSPKGSTEANKEPESPLRKKFIWKPRTPLCSLETTGRVKGKGKGKFLIWICGAIKAGLCTRNTRWLQL